MTLDFYTPIETINVDLWMDFPERDRSVSMTTGNALTRRHGEHE
jgi:hypothetical protein